MEALTDRGIPVYADARENLLDAPHIRPLIALLKVIDNPAQDIYLAAAMLGPLFDFTDDDLVRLRARAEEIQKQQGENAPQRISLYGALLLTVNSGEDTPFTGKVRAFYARLTELRRMARSRPGRTAAGGDLCFHRLPCCTGRDGKRCPPPGGCPTVCLLLRRGRSGGISALVRAIDAAAQAGSTGQDTVPGGARPGCVTIMTIHRSKGLQFPVVFVADTARRFNAADTRQPVLLHRMVWGGPAPAPRGGRGRLQDGGLHGALQCPRRRDAQ